MAEVSWVKLATNIFDDEKILIIDSMPEPDAVEIMWIKLICQAGKCNAGGWIWLSEDIPYTEENLAAIFKRPLNTVRMALGIFQKLSMLEVSERGLFLPGFAKYNDLTALERIRKNQRVASKNYRDRQLTLNYMISNDASYDVIGKNKIRLEEEKNREDKRSLMGAVAPINCCFTFEDYKNLLSVSENHVGFLVEAFKRLHSTAPASDFENAGGRLGKLWATNNRDTGYILKKMWDTAADSIAGSHLSYIQAALGKASKSKDPDRFVKGKYGHMVMR